MIDVDPAAAVRFSYQDLTAADIAEHVEDTDNFSDGGITLDS